MENTHKTLYFVPSAILCTLPGCSHLIYLIPATDFVSQNPITDSHTSNLDWQCASTDFLNSFGHNNIDFLSVPLTCLVPPYSGPLQYAVLYLECSAHSFPPTPNSKAIIQLTSTFRSSSNVPYSERPSLSPNLGEIQLFHDLITLCIFLSSSNLSYKFM